MVLVQKILNTRNLVACAIALFACWKAVTVEPGKKLEGHISRQRNGVQARYFIPNKNIGHIAHVMRSFERGGYDLIRPTNYTENWDVMWTYHNPFYNRDENVNLPPMMQQLKVNQKVNQLPGASFFTSKVDLAKESPHLQLLPKSFLVPSQYDDFIAYHKSQPKGTTWVKKGSKHRGVVVVDPYDPTLKEDGQENFVQQFIQPYLIDGHSWDLGIYIAITSVNPLRAYYYDNVLLRFCSLPFNEDIENAERDSYVVEDDYIPPWGMESLRKYYMWGLSTLNALRAHFSSQGLDIDEVLNQALHGINELLVHFQPKLDNSALRYPNGQKNFFAIYRADFLVDRNLRPWLMEINQSPNLSSAHTRDLANMFEQISHGLLSLMGFMPGGINHPATTKDEADLIVHTSDVDIAFDVCADCVEDCSNSAKCVLCRRCRMPSQSNFIREMISEHRNRQGFIRLHPMSEKLDPNLTAAVCDTPNDLMQREWIKFKCRHDFTWC